MALPILKDSAMAHVEYLSLPRGGVEKKVVQVTVTNAEHVRAGVQSCQRPREPAPNEVNARRRLRGSSAKREQNTRLNYHSRGKTRLG